MLELQHHIEVWRQQRHIVETMPIERLTTYLRFDPASAFALVDAIVCGADSLFSFENGWVEPTYALPFALYVAKDVRRLPEGCAMRDGRKWRTIPFIIFANAGASTVSEMPNGVHVLPPLCNPYPLLALRQIRRHVDDYYNRILADYRSLGMLVRYENGHVQIGPALRKRNPTRESSYYHGGADRRSNRGWVTIKRDHEGLRYDVEIFENLLESKATETQMHRFLEQHPAFLMDAMLGVPLSHRPVFSDPKQFTPDYSLVPILGADENNMVEMLELKGPSETTLAGRLHRGFTSKVTRAVDQVRDYDRYLRDPANAEAVLASFGYIPDKSRLAVLIGRMPEGSDHEVFLRRRAETNVKIVTYDEILEVQASQVRGPLDRF
jgi:hypothetical protein